MMIRIVGGWMFLLVPAHPGSPGQRAVKTVVVVVAVHSHAFHCWLSNWQVVNLVHLYIDLCLYPTARCLSLCQRPLGPQVNISRSVMHRHCDVRPTVTFPAKQHCYCSLATTHFPSSTPHHTPQPFYGSFPGPPWWAGAGRELLDFMVQGKINTGRHTDHLAGCHSIRTKQYSPPPSPQ